MTRVSERGAQLSAAEEGRSPIQTARVVSEQARSLAGHRKAGEGRDQPCDCFRALKEVVDDAEQESARAELEQPSIAAWAKVSDLMRRVQPYFES